MKMFVIYKTILNTYFKLSNSKVAKNLPGKFKKNLELTIKAKKNLEFKKFWKKNLIFEQKSLKNLKKPVILNKFYM